MPIGAAVGCCAPVSLHFEPLRQQVALPDICSIISRRPSDPQLPAAVASMDHAAGNQRDSFYVHPAVLDCSTHTAAALAGPNDAEGWILDLHL